MSKKSWKEIEPGILVRSYNGVVEIEIHGSKKLEVGHNERGVDIAIEQRQLVVLSIVGQVGADELFYNVQDRIKAIRND